MTLNEIQVWVENSKHDVEWKQEAFNRAMAVVSQAHNDVVEARLVLRRAITNRRRAEKALEEVQTSVIP